jgi:hypothetical protein
MTLTRALAEWIASTGPSRWLQSVDGLVPSVQTVHILAIGVLLTCVTMFNARLAGLIGRTESSRQAAESFVPPVWWALLVLAISGLVLVVAEPHRELENQLFLIKMLLVALSAVTTVLAIRWSSDSSYEQLSKRARGMLSAMAMASTTLWLLIIACGRWIAYVDVLGQ